MASREQEIRTKIALDGESEYRKACQDINASLRALDSELKLTAAKFEDNADSIEALTAKQDILSKKYDEQKLKVAAAEEMLKKYTETGKANTKEAKNMETQLNKAKLALVQTEKELKQTAAQLEEAEKATGEFDSTLDDMSATAEESTGVLSKLGDSLNMGTVLKGGITAAAAGVAALGTAAAAAGKYALDFAGDVDSAMNSFQATTGIATEQAGAFEDAMLDIYNDNFGDDLTDISEAMSEVARQTQEVDPTKVAELTENALMLRDVFGYDVNESIRAANMLMEQFGVSGDEAYTLIAQGAQKGLDKNGDMLDTINEYSVQFEQLGFSAEEMFDVLISGAKSGAFSVDKVGDAVKEFGVRVKDGSDSTAGAFEDLGLNVEEISSDFAKGGESAKKAFKKVTDALFSMEDPLEQNQAGVALFGTMWEDLGVDGVKALTSLTKQVDKTADTLEDINDIKYDDLDSAFEGIKRSINTGFILPIGEKALPAFKDFAETISKGAKEADGDIEKMSDVFGEALGDLAADLTTIIPDFIDFGNEIIYGLVDGIAEAAPELGEAIGELSAEFLNKLPDLVATVFDAGVQLISGFVSGLVEGVPLLDALFGDIVNKNKEVYDALDANIENVTAFSEAIKSAEPSVVDYDALINEYGESLSDLNAKISDTETAITETLAQALQDQQALREEDLENVNAYTDELYEAQLKKLEFYRQQQNVELLKIQADMQNLTQETAAQYIVDAQQALNEANAATEEAYNQRLGIIQNKYTAMGEIGSEAYNTEIKSAKDFYDEQIKQNEQYYSNALGTVIQAAEDWIGTDENKWALLAEYANNFSKNSEEGWQNYVDTIADTADGIWGVKDTFAEALSQMDLDSANAFLAIIENTKIYGGQVPVEAQAIAQNILTSFDGLPNELDEAGKEALLSLIGGLEENIPELQNTTDLTANDIVDILRERWGLDYEASAFNKAGSDAVADLKEAIEAGRGNVEDAAKSVSKRGVMGASFYNDDGSFWWVGSDAVADLKEAIEAGRADVEGAAKSVSNAGLTGMRYENDIGSFWLTGSDSTQSYVSGIGSGEGDAESAGTSISNSALAGANHFDDIGSFWWAGADSAQSYTGGVSSGEDDAGSAGVDISSSAYSGASYYGSGSFWQVGSDSSQGYINGFKSNESQLYNIAAGMATGALGAMQRELDSHSPSRKFMKLGEYSAEGYAIGFEREFERSKSILSKAIEVNASPKALVSAATAKPTSTGKAASSVTVVQNIFAKDTSYYGQQKEAARQLQLVARGLSV